LGRPEEALEIVENGRWIGSEETSGTGEVTPVVLVTDNGGPFRSFRFAAFIAAHPELRHVRTRVNTPGQNGVRERAFESLKYERLYREDIVDVLDLTRHAEEFRIEFNTIDHTRRCPGTGRGGYISASPARPSPPLNKPKSCHFLDRGTPGRVPAGASVMDGGLLAS
jgi:hypothetical protein